MHPIPLRSQCNARLREILYSLMTDALMRHAFKTGDIEGARALYKRGAEVHGGTLQIAGLKAGGNDIVEVLGQVRGGKGG